MNRNRLFNVSDVRSRAPSLASGTEQVVAGDQTCKHSMTYWKVETKHSMRSSRRYMQSLMGQSTNTRKREMQCGFFVVIHQSLRRKVQELLVDLKKAQMTMDQQSGERDDMWIEVDHLNSQHKRASHEIQNLCWQNMDLMIGNALLRERLGEPEQEENQEPQSVLRKLGKREGTILKTMYQMGTLRYWEPPWIF